MKPRPVFTHCPTEPRPQRSGRRRQSKGVVNRTATTAIVVKHHKASRYTQIAMAYDEGLADRIRTALGPRGGFSERKMFGGLCFMVNGNMCCGIVGNDLMLRLTPQAVSAALREPHTRPMDFTGKPMKSMIYVAAAGLDSDESLETWIQSADRIARAMPAKGGTRGKRST